MIQLETDQALLEPAKLQPSDAELRAQVWQLTQYVQSLHRDVATLRDLLDTVLNP